MKVYESIMINRNSEEPLYIQVYEGIKGLIENGVFKPNEKLPPIRSLALKLGVNNVTIVNAYKLLEQKGFVYSKMGSGTFVRGYRTPNLSNISVQVVTTVDKESINKNKGEINLSTSTPNPKLFPVNEFKEILNEVLDRDGGFAFGYQESQGYFPLRESIKYFLEENQMTVDISNIQIISGAQQGIDIVTKALIGFNDTIVVESPTYTGAIAAFKSRGANIIEVPIMEDGIDTAKLEDALKTHRPKLVYVMTSFQNPTGISYSEDKKIQLLYLAEKYDTYILEDDYLSELRFYGKGSMPIKSLDANDRVIYLKSFSKIFMPGIRLGFIVTPSLVTRDILNAKHTTDISTSGLMQRAFDLYLRKRKWEDHIRIMWDVYKKRYDIMVETLKEETPFINFNLPSGGIHIWGSSDLDSTVLSSMARQRGVLIAPGKLFYLDERDSNYFRLSFAGVECEEIAQGIKLLKEAYADLKNVNINSIVPFL